MMIYRLGWLLLGLLAGSALLKATQRTKHATSEGAEPEDAGTAASAPAPAARAARPAALTTIEGIGPKIQEILNDAGVDSCEALAASSPDQLRAILAQAGSRFRMHDPSTWPEQAKLAAAGDLDGLAALQKKLKGGRKA